MSRIIPSDTLWICGQYSDEDDDSDMWSMTGVFSTEQKAVEQCSSYMHFVAPLTLDQGPDDDSGEWPGTYRPLVS